MQRVRVLEIALAFGARSREAPQETARHQRVGLAADVVLLAMKSERGLDGAERGPGVAERDARPTQASLHVRGFVEARGGRDRERFDEQRLRSDGGAHLQDDFRLDDPHAHAKLIVTARIGGEACLSENSRAEIERVAQQHHVTERDDGAGRERSICHFFPLERAQKLR